MQQNERTHDSKKIECAKVSLKKNQLSAESSFVTAPLLFFDETKSSNKVGQAWNMIWLFNVSILQLSNLQEVKVKEKNAPRQLRNLGG